MIRSKLLSLFVTLTLIAACGDDATQAAPDLKTLPIPTITVSVSDQTATVRWAIAEPIEAVRYTFELYAGDAQSPVQSATTRLTSQRFELEPGLAYRFRVKTVAPLGSAKWQDSEFSDYMNISGDMLGAPEVRLIGKTTNSATLSWTAIPGAVKYAYELYKDTAATAEQSAEVSGTTALLTGLTEYTAYRFRVKAVANDQGIDSSYSEALSFTTDRTPVDPDVTLGLPLANENDGILRAFPGAEGGGMYTTGGRGGKVYHVTNLNDSGTGSLRAAVEASEKRIVVFDVAGTIALKSELRIKYGNITIAGQTAPGQGICIKDNTVRVDADNVIIRYLRFRLGNESANLSDGSDAIWGRYHKNIILDHCSMSWAIDECASFYANQNFTMQWCIISECLRVSGVHSKNTHGYGGIWGGKNASFHHNLLANNDSRNARIDHPEIYGDYKITHRGNVDYRNNVIYNWGSNSTYGGEDGYFNIVGNYYKPGPASKERRYFVDACGYYSSSGTTYPYPKLYLNGNYHAGSYAASINSDNWAGVYLHDSGAYGATADMKVSLLPIRADGSTTCYTTTHTADGAYQKVVANAGASLQHDNVDVRITNEATTGTVTYPKGTTSTSEAAGSTSAGGMIDSQSVVGGWPVLSATSEQASRAATDTDGDGIPDYYEELLGLNLRDASDANTKTLDPQGIYPNIEVYFHYLVRDVTAAQIAGGTYTALE